MLYMKRFHGQGKGRDEGLKHQQKQGEGRPESACGKHGKHLTEEVVKEQV